MRVSAFFALGCLAMAQQPLAVAADAADPIPLQLAQASDDLAVDRLIARGDEFLALHDIFSARLLFELAADRGDAEAAAKMGLTYDPLHLRSIGVHDYAGDPDSALDWYGKAVDQGYLAATAQLDRLHAYAKGGPATPVTAPPSAAAAEDPGFRVQLVAMKSEQAAREQAAWLQETYGEFLGNKNLSVERLELSGNRGIIFGVRAEPFDDKLAADQLCAALHAKSQGCFVVP